VAIFHGEVWGCVPSSGHISPLWTGNRWQATCIGVVFNRIQEDHEGAGMKYFTGVLILVLCFSSLRPERKIVETVDVDWWVVPLFALDRGEGSVTDLYNKDISLKVNGNEIRDFTLLKRQFSIRDTGREGSAEMVRKEKGKIGFLVFDIAYRSAGSLKKSLKVAADLIAGSSVNARFVVMTVDPFSGLKYLYGPSIDKGLLYQVLKKRVKMLPGNRKSFTGRQTDGMLRIPGSADRNGVERGKYASAGARFFIREMAGRQVQQDRHFFFSFESLYYSLNQITDNKFIFFFSEGLSMRATKILPGGVGEFYKNLVKSARYMGQSGSVIFMIDPAPVGTDSDPRSGGDSIRSLTLESGGKYLRGSVESISGRLENMSRAYYEIAFATPLRKGARKLDIQLTPRRKGVRIHSLRTLEKRKSYGDMTPVEREVLVLNLLNPNIFFRPPLEVRGFTQFESRPGRKRTSVVLELPGKYRRKQVDIYLVEKGDREPGDYHIDKSTQEMRGRSITVTGEAGKMARSRIVLIDQKNNVAYVDGVIDPDDRFMKTFGEVKRKFSAKREKMSPADRVKLDFILKGTEEYCETLENAAFHFVCTEEISGMAKKLNLRSRHAKSRYGVQDNRMIRRPIPGEFQGDPVRKTTTRQTWDYQLIQANGKVLEQRRPVKRGKVENEEPISGLKVESFISRKIALTPTAIFGILNRNRFDFRLAGQMGSVLDVKCRIDYDLKREGLRFPTDVTIAERYHGGGFLRRVLGVSSWERSKAVYKYTDYMFFGVKAEILRQE